MKRKTENAGPATAKPAWSVVVVYENTEARERAVQFCDQLVARFWARLELEVSWWSFEELEDLGAARKGLEKAATAEVVICAAAAEGEFPPAVDSWLQSWQYQRRHLEGKLVGLLQPAEATGTGRQLYLRAAAHHCSMDYLTEVPQEPSLIVPESFDSYTDRASEVTSLLSGILHQPPTPPPTPLP